MMRFVYSVIRFVPDPARGEFINVGAIAGSDESSEWGLRQVQNTKRAREIDDRGTIDAVSSFLNRIGRDIDLFTEANEQLFHAGVSLSEEWLEQIYVDQRNIVQISRPAPILADDAEQALDQVFDQLIIDPAAFTRRPTFRTKHAALAALRFAYGQYSIAKSNNLVERPELRTNKRHRENVDFAVTNGHALQLTQAWSFQVPHAIQIAEQVKAWGWTIRDLREDGGLLIGEENEIDVPPDVDIEVVYVPPADDNTSLLVEAENVFDALDVVAVPTDQAQVVSERAYQLLRDEGVRLDFR